MGEQCPYCGSTRWGRGPVRAELAYRRCRTCGSGYLPEEPIAFRDYYEAYAPDLVADLPPILARRYAAMLARLEAWAPRRTLLEVGCGNGHFLAVARDRGWEVRGVELSRAHVERARAMGLDVAYGDVAADALFAGERFGAVVMIEVLEHVPDPRGLLAACAARLDEDGVLFLTTPNFGSVTRRLLGSRWSVLSHEHVGLATPAGLRRALGGAGFSVLRLRTRSLYLGEYRRLLAGRGARRTTPLAAENAGLRDRIEESRLLSAAKAGVNVVLGASGLGESTECWARKVRNVAGGA